MSEPDKDMIQKMLAKLSMADIQKMQERAQLQEEAVQRKERGAKKTEDYKFWKTQPVPRLEEAQEGIEKDGAIEPDKAFADVQQDPYPLPKDFEWTALQIEKESEIKDVYELLSLNYVEDDDCTFRFDYSPEFLKWALQPPGWKHNWHIGVRVSSSKKLVAFISAIPAMMKIRDHQQPLVEINFLCVHKKLRSKRLAPMMIKEITRRVNLEGIFQATYTAGSYLPRPFSTCRYYHRSLNPKKLVETGFSGLGRNVTMARLIKLMRVPDSVSNPGFREMTEKDSAQVCSLLNGYMRKFKVAPHFTEAEVRHWMIPIVDVVYSYVVENPSTKKITHFVSFYNLPSSVLGHPVHKHLKAAYLFYWATPSQGKDVEDVKTLIQNALIMARKNGFDVFNCLNLMDNGVFIEDLKFGKGDGELHYYFYNYRCTPMESQETGLVLL